MSKPRGRSRRRRQQYEQSVPLVLGRRTVSRREVVQPVVIQPAWVAAGLGVALLLALTLWFAFSPRFYVTGVQVVGASRVSPDELLAASGLAHIHILWTNGRAAATRILAQLPAVKEAEVSCSLPANCVISVVEWPPLLNWETADGRRLWVDGAGAVSPADHPLEGRWTVVGDLPTDDRGLVERDVLLGLAELTRLGIEPGRVIYRSGRGLVLVDPAGWRVVVGQGTGMAERLRTYGVLRNHLLQRGIQPRFVDVRFPEAPYYSETNDW